ncbi:hypothetical protein NLI96_g3441 [Meripilus lineatus]|uniref:Uncharacterized protein n=1 Tax=Meripilus lineatus TaxID=2056292 RepID=A0AAD5V6R5_9APHY|nr:hypothetical protein NLI96_g3441 [Physisporinus lineatus]
MPEKSGFRPRPKAFTGGRKPFNLAEAEANADAGWSRRKPEDEPPQSLQTKICGAYEHVKDKVFSLFRREPVKSERTQPDAQPAISKAELRRRAVEIVPVKKTPAICNNRKPLTEFKFKKNNVPMIIDIFPVDTLTVDNDSIMSDSPSVFAWSSTETLLYDVEMSDDDDMNTGAKCTASPMIIEDWGQTSLCSVFTAKLNLNTSHSSSDTFMMTVDESMDDFTSSTYRAFEAVTTTTQDVIMLSPPDRQVLHDKAGFDNITPVTCARPEIIFGHGRAASGGVVRTSKTVSRNARFDPYHFQRDGPTHSRLNKHPLAGFGTFVNGGAYRGTKGRLVKRHHA